MNNLGRRVGACGASVDACSSKGTKVILYGGKLTRQSTVGDSRAKQSRDEPSLWPSDCMMHRQKPTGLSVARSALQIRNTSLLHLKQTLTWNLMKVASSIPCIELHVFSATSCRRIVYLRTGPSAQILRL